MLLVARAGREPDVEAVFEKWDLQAAVIGKVMGDGILRVRKAGEAVAEVPARALAEDAPFYDREQRRPPELDELQDLALASVLEPSDFGAVLTQLLVTPTLASKNWIYDQYDHMVRSNTLVLPGSDAAVIRIKGTPLGLALSLDGNGRYAYLDPYRGGVIAVAEACRNVAAAGALPIGATNCLNFGNPEKPEVMWQFARVVDGIAEACRALEVPITGGNVSFYNETEGQGVYPTPVLGVVGLLEDKSRRLTHPFQARRDLIYLAGDMTEELGGSEYLKVVHRMVRGRPPAVDLEKEKALHQLTREAALLGLLRSSHDLADGGLAVALAEATFGPPGLDGEQVGAVVALESPRRADTVLFSEGQSRMLWSVPPEAAERLESLAEDRGVSLSRIGVTGGDRLTIRVNGVEAVALEVDALSEAFGSAIAKAIEP
jgi:phosphoribosylformylglycinamidine synthase